MQDERRNLRNATRRSMIATWIVLALSVVAAALVALYLRHPSG